MPANKISHNSGMAQLPLAISGKPFTTMKKALFHGHLRVFGEKMNTSVYRLSHATLPFDVPTASDCRLSHAAGDRDREIVKKHCHPCPEQRIPFCK